jgi:hypothetical protein
VQGYAYLSGHPRVLKKQSLHGSTIHFESEHVNEATCAVDDVPNILPCLAQAVAGVDFLPNFVDIGHTYQTTRAWADALVLHRCEKYSGK